VALYDHIPIQNFRIHCVLAARQHVQGTVHVRAQWAGRICGEIDSKSMLLIAQSACAISHDIALFKKCAGGPKALVDCLLTF
jgi:hypothetical protein